MILPLFMQAQHREVYERIEEWTKGSKRSSFILFMGGMSFYGILFINGGRNILCGPQEEAKWANKM